jgi:hypothetical protein
MTTRLQRITTRVTNLRRKKFRTTCLGSPDTKPACRVWAQRKKKKKKCLILAHHIKVKTSLNNYFFRTWRLYKSILMFTMWLASILRKLATSTRWHELYFTQRQRTDNTGPAFKCCILHTIIIRYINNSSSCRFSGLSAVRNECSFIPYRKDKIRTVREKIRTVGDTSHNTEHHYVVITMRNLNCIGQEVDSPGEGTCGLLNMLLPWGSTAHSLSESWWRSIHRVT